MSREGRIALFLKRILGPVCASRVFVALDWFTDRMAEDSSWRGITGILTAIGVVAVRENSEVIVGIGLFIMGLINFFKHDDMRGIENKMHKLERQLEAAKKRGKRVRPAVRKRKAKPHPGV